MSNKEQQLSELLSLTSRSLTHLTASLTSLAFDLLRSQDPGVRHAATKMIGRMEAVSHELDQQWQLISELTGVQAPERTAGVEEVQLQSLL